MLVHEPLVVQIGRDDIYETVHILNAVDRAQLLQGCELPRDYKADGAGEVRVRKEAPWLVAAGSSEAFFATSFEKST